jgi:hypothetical protein
MAACEPGAGERRTERPAQRYLGRRTLSKYAMDYNKDKVDKMVLALLSLTMSHDQKGPRAWKGHDRDAPDRLYKKGYIPDPKSKAKSVTMTEGVHSEPQSCSRSTLESTHERLPSGRLPHGEERAAP